MRNRFATEEELEFLGGNDFFQPTDLGFVAPSLAAPVAPVAPQPPAWQSLAQSLGSQWQAMGIDPTMSGINRAEELAKILTNYGITDLSKLGLKDVAYTGYEPESYGEGENLTYTGAMLPVALTGKQLTYGDKAFGYLGGFGSKGQQEFGAQPYGLDEYMRDPNLLAWSAAGKGNVSYRTVQAPNGQVYIVPEWGSSSDWGDFRTVAKLAATVASMGGAGAGLGATLGLGTGAAGQAIGNAILGGLASGDARGALIGGIGSLASPAIGEFGKAAGEAVGGGTLGDIASRAVSGAGRSALGAAVSGGDIGEALLTGGLGGAAGAVSSNLVGELGLPEPVTRVGTTALTSALLGRDVDAAVANAIKGEIFRAIQQPAVTDTGDETDRLIARYGTAEQAQARENAALDDLIASLAPSSTPLPDTGRFELEELLAQPELRLTGANEREKFLEANIEDPLERLLARPAEEVDWSAVYAEPSVLPGYRDPDGFDVLETALAGAAPSELSAQDFGVAPQSDINEVYNRIMDERGGFASTWQTVGSDRVMVQDDGSAIGINTETGETYGLDQGETQRMVDAGLLNTETSGYEEAIRGKTEPAAAAPAPAPAPSPAPSPAPAAKKKQDDLGLLMLLSSMLTQQDKDKEDYQVANVLGARSPFGNIYEGGTQDDLLRILRG